MLPTTINSDRLLERFVPVLFMKTDVVKRLKKTRKNVKRCGTTRSGALRKQHVCDLCDYKTAQKTHFTQHYLTHTGEKPFECDICDYKATTKQQLYHHKLTHTGVKAFECELCDYNAATKANLARHQLTHTGVKLFECDICDFKATTKGHLSYYTTNLLTQELNLSHVLNATTLLYQRGA